MNMRHRDLNGTGDADLGWLIRCTTGCEGVVRYDPSPVGGPCPLCNERQQKSGNVTEIIKILPADKLSEAMSLEGGISFERDEFRPWDVDLGSFLESSITDAGDMTHVGGPEDISLGERVVVQIPEMTPDEKIYGNPESKVFGSDAESPGQSSSVNQPQVIADTSLSARMLNVSDNVCFTKWHVVGLVLCALLLLVGGLMTFDIVRYLYSPDNTTITSPLLRFLR